MIEDYLKRITNYIFDSRLSRALLIDGDWECGKSYFVKNTLVDTIDKTKVPKRKRLIMNRIIRRKSQIKLNITNLCWYLFMDGQGHWDIGATWCHIGA